MVFTRIRNVLRPARLAVCLLVSLLTGLTGPLCAHAAELALVMDDVGHNWARDRRAVTLATPMTIAVLPFAPLSEPLAELAHGLGQEIILHQPMEPERGHYHRIDRGTLTLDMDPTTFDTLLLDAIAQLPYCVGVNNHTGSLLTRHEAPMRRLMQRLAQEGLYFLDSRTTAQTVAYRVAQQHQVPAISRDVFLDHDQSWDAIDREFERALMLARTKGSAVLIAHPYPNSLDYLTLALAKLPPDIRLVPLSRLIEKRQPRPRAVLARPQSPAFLHTLPGQ